MSLLFGLESVFITAREHVICCERQETQGIPTRSEGGFNMGDIEKGMFTIPVILYILSPVDFAPGPAKDAIVLLLE